MSAFDTVELQPISDPIKPDPEYPFQSVLIGVGGGLVAVVIFVFIIITLKRTNHEWGWDPHIRQLRGIRRQLKLYERRSKDDFEPDLDHWWQLLESFLLPEIKSTVASPSLEEFRTLVADCDLINTQYRHLIAEIAELLEQVRYSGKAEPEKRARLIELFVAAFNGISQEEMMA